MPQGRPKRRRPTLVAVVLIALFSTKAQSACEDPSHVQGASGWCYGMTSGKEKWEDISSECLAMSMVAANFAAEDQPAISSLIGNDEVWTPAFCGNNPSNPGSGCTDRGDANSEWRFTDTSYSWITNMWQNNEPDDCGSCYCVLLEAAGFKTKQCSKKEKVLCKVAGLQCPPPPPSP
eukprot:Hpha_TRINITY_DN656_c0_g1::TRINITY_DN656_c0_g1_i1::g.21330::m.21330